MEVPVLGRPGIRFPYVKYFSLHYQMMNDKIVITMMPSPRLFIPNVEFIHSLTKNLNKIKSIIEAA